MRTILFFLSFSLFSWAQSQNCTYTATIDSNYRDDINYQLLFNALDDSTNVNYDSIRMPIAQVEKILGLFTVIDAQAQDFNIHTWEVSLNNSYPMGIRFSIYDSIPWKDTLVQYGNYSSFAPLDSFMQLYNLHSQNYLHLNNFIINEFYSSDILNFNKLRDEFQLFSSYGNIELIYNAIILGMSCDGYFTLKESTAGDTLTFGIQNNWSPFASSSYWTYFIDVNCNATLVNKQVGICPATPIKEIKQNISVYPNPVNAILNISIEKKITSYGIYNNLGQAVEEKTLLFNTNSIYVDVQDYPDGIYFIKVNEQYTQFVKR